jgi:hypothetical protein
VTTIESAAWSLTADGFSGPGVEPTSTKLHAAGTPYIDDETGAEIMGDTTVEIVESVWIHNGKTLTPTKYGAVK